MFCWRNYRDFLFCMAMNLGAGSLGFALGSMCAGAEAACCRSRVSFLAVEEFLRASRGSRLGWRYACVAPHQNLEAVEDYRTHLMYVMLLNVVLPKLALAFAILFLVARPFLLMLVVPVTSSL